jgi:hypothetical protein
MTLRLVTPVVAVAALGAALSSFSRDAGAQAQVDTAAKPASSKAWTAPRAPDGHPDLQGIWTNATVTPLERPANLAGKEFLTPDEAAALERQSDDANRAQAQTDIHYDNDLWLGLTTRPDRPRVVSTLRTSLVVDPPDGKIPPMTEEGRRRAAARTEAFKLHPSDGPENRTLQERCIWWVNEGPPMIPQGRIDQNSNLEIVQTASNVVVHQEMIHDARVIPLDGRPHLPAHMKQWLGDSRGRWEGDTLVVDTTNFTDRTNFRGASGTLHVVERFTRTAPDTIMYRFTVEDPATWSRSWSGESPLRRTAGPIYEYACHEGNYGLLHILRGARHDERMKESGAK